MLSANLCELLQLLCHRHLVLFYGRLLRFSMLSVQLSQTVNMVTLLKVDNALVTRGDPSHFVPVSLQLCLLTATRQRHN